MSERLRAHDLAFLTEETASAPRHNATIEVFRPGPEGFSYDRLLDLVEDRIAFVPRYRQRVRFVPGRLANPVWVDDADFDLGYHVRRSALPRPGSLDQLRELVARIVSRPLDRQRPLWEIYVVEGLADAQVALLYKTHQVLVDGLETVDLGQMLLDSGPEHTVTDEGQDSWRPGPPSTPASLVLAAIRDTIVHPVVAVDTTRSVVSGALRTVEEARHGVSRVVNAISGRQVDRVTPISGPLSFQRRIVVADTPLESYRTVREAHGGTVNDVILATVAGGLRGWLMTRGAPVGGLRQIRALVPVSVLDDDLAPTSLGSPVDAHFVDLPIGEQSPVVRLHQVSYSFQVHKDTGRAVGAGRLAQMAGFAPATFHAVAARVAAAEVRRAFQLTITNVPGPQTPLFAAGAQMVASYPVPALLPGHALAIGVTSYDGKVFYGVTADRDLVPDADVLGQCLVEALDELVDTTTGERRRVPRGRRAKTRRTTKAGSTRSVRE
ncbi:MAG: wax ester/triacylglycerol synthase family O-acyltransferase [Nocardioides sp.]|nr:wax ester/triacylglycerol synthase family O-acyltransferase [Nocardioides sp.]